MVEQRTENPCVPGSIPGPATTPKNTSKINCFDRFLTSKKGPYSGRKKTSLGQIWATCRPLAHCIAPGGMVLGQRPGQRGPGQLDGPIAWGERLEDGRGQRHDAHIIQAEVIVVVTGSNLQGELPQLRQAAAQVGEPEVGQVIARRQEAGRQVEGDEDGGGSAARRKGAVADGYVQPGRGSAERPVEGRVSGIGQGKRLRRKGAGGFAAIWLASAAGQS